MVCPTDDLWRRLLLDELSESEAEPLDAHLTSCAACRERLERLTDPRDMPELRGLLESATSPPGWDEQLCLLTPTQSLLPNRDRSEGAISRQELVPGSAAQPTLERDASAFRLMGDATSEVVTSDVRPMPVIDGYEVLREVGRGGMGVVYQARQLGLNRLVALKVILAAEHASPEILRRFRVEAEATARLRHPGIVQVYELGVTNGSPFLAMEFIAGQTLAQRLRTSDSTLTSRQAAEWLLDVTRAMSVAHRQGIVHRDLKPSNILLDADGSPKVTDFGIAKQAGQELTASGLILGTPSYMSPEQAAGKVREIGPPADVYSLGAILYELLAGHPPFRAESAVETVMQVLLHDPATPTRSGQALPRDLVAIAMKCLRKNPAERYADAAALADDLQRFLNGNTTQARPQSLATRTLRWAKHHRASLSIALLAILLIASVAALFARRNPLIPTDVATYIRPELSENEPPESNPEHDADSEPEIIWLDVPIGNSSFESTSLAPGERRAADDTANDWDIETPARTSAFLFRPTDQTYKFDSGTHLPLGADGFNVLSLARESGDLASPSAAQTLAARVEPGCGYALTVAVGYRLKTEPAHTKYGGFRLELFAGPTLLGHLTDEEDAPVGQFDDFTLTIPANQIPSDMVGQPLKIRLQLTKPGENLNTDFDHVRLLKLRPTPSPTSQLNDD